MKSTRTFTAILSALALTGTAFTSCQDYAAMEEDEIRLDLVKNEYTKNFISIYGEIDPNHTWGFEPMSAHVTTSSPSTRADGDTGAGEVYVRTNQWAVPNTDEYLANRITIPGWPNFDGKYYYKNGGSYLTTDKANLDIENMQPIGDVTDYEVEYVSRFFREHTFEQLRSYMVELHLSDFFIQNISCDYDRQLYPDGQAITTSEEHPKAHKLNEDGGDMEKNSLNYGMDHLMFRTIGAPVFPNVNEQWTHMNNYNNGNTNHITNENNTPEYSNREIKYVTSSGTEDFAYQSSLATGEIGTYYDNYVLIRLAWVETVDGTPYNREGYYLAFDYEAEKTSGNIKIDRDGRYSNWIVKITPGHYKSTKMKEGFPRRIMCEDLGNTCDFDFNDVVFDVYYEANSTARKCDAVITLQAAGGTMPIFVGNYDNNYEAHKLLGQSTSSVPVNVKSGASHEVAIYRVPVTYRDDNKYNPDEIDIHVNGYKLDQVRQNLDKYNNGEKSTQNAPQKFSVPSAVKWLKESEPIKNCYPKFADWVQSDNEENKNWYLTTANEGRLCQGTIFTYTYEEEEEEIGGDYNYSVDYGTSIGYNIKIFDEWTSAIRIPTNSLNGGVSITVVFENAQLNSEYNIELGKTSEEYNQTLQVNGQQVKTQVKDGVNGSKLIQFDITSSAYSGFDFIQPYSGQDCLHVKGVYVKPFNSGIEESENAYIPDGYTKIDVQDFVQAKAFNKSVFGSANSVELVLCYITNNSNENFSGELKKSKQSGGDWIENTDTWLTASSVERDSSKKQSTLTYSINVSDMEGYDYVVLPEVGAGKLTGCYCKTMSSSAKRR